MSISKERLELMRKVLKIGRDLSLSQTESLQMQIIDDSVVIINDRIIANEQISENTILALSNLLSVIETTMEKSKKELAAEKEAHKNTYNKYLDLL